MMQEITSAHNPQIKELRALTSMKKARRESGRFIIEGWRGLDTLLTFDSPHYTLEKLVVTTNWKGDARLPEHIDTLLLPDPLFEKITDVKNAQGILGVVKHTPQPFKIKPGPGNYLLLDGISDPGNLGTLIRSAVGAEFDGILLYNDCVDSFSPKVIRSTMGTFAFTGIHTISPETLDELEAAGYRLVATTGTEGDNLYETDFGAQTVLAVGSEAHGVSEEIMRRANQRITIPLAKECESLNAAIAGSICMFHITREPGKPKATN
jgi:TrmH family RNA methyltransferase